MSRNEIIAVAVLPVLLTAAVLAFSGEGENA